MIGLSLLLIVGCSAIILGVSHFVFKVITDSIIEETDVIEHNGDREI